MLCLKSKTKNCKPLMPLLNENKSEDEKSFAFRWYEVRNRVKEQFGQRPDINAMLFIIGINEVGIVKENGERRKARPDACGQPASYYPPMATTSLPVTMKRAGHIMKSTPACRRWV